MQAFYATIGQDEVERITDRCVFECVKWGCYLSLVVLSPSSPLPAVFVPVLLRPLPQPSPVPRLRDPQRVPRVRAQDIVSGGRLTGGRPPAPREGGAGGGGRWGEGRGGS